MFMDSKGQEFGQHTAEMAYFCFTMSGASSEKNRMVGVIWITRAGIIWRFLHSQIRPGAGVTSRLNLGEVVDWSICTWPLHLTCLLIIWQLGSQMEHPERECLESKCTKGIRWEPCGFYDLALEVTLCHSSYAILIKVIISLPDFQRAET